MSNRLRKLLEEMTADLDIGTYPQRLSEIALLAPHTIAEIPAPNDEPLDNFNCVMYALRDRRQGRANVYSVARGLGLVRRHRIHALPDRRGDIEAMRGEHRRYRDLVFAERNPARGTARRTRTRSV